MAFGLVLNDLVHIATDRLQTEEQKATRARVDADLKAKELQEVSGPEMSARDRVRVGVSGNGDHSQQFAPANASQFTSSVPIKV